MGPGYSLVCVIAIFSPAAGMTNFIEISEFRLAAHSMTKFMKFHAFFQHEAFFDAPQISQWSQPPSLSGRSAEYQIYIEFELNNLLILLLICGDHIR